MQKLSWQAVGLVAIIAGVVIALATLTKWGSGEIIGVVGLLAGIGGGAAVAGGMSGRVEEIHANTSAQGPVLDTVARRLNGELDQRISAAQEEAAEQGAARVIQVLRDQGVIH